MHGDFLLIPQKQTKIMPFRKRDGLLPTERWTYDSLPIDVVIEFNYLGTVLAILVTLDQILNMLLVSLLSN